MRKKRKLLKHEISEANKDFVIFNEVDGILTYEIGKEITNDLAEAVSILMWSVNINDPIWESEVKESHLENIVPERALFWLSGGYKEWETLIHYNKPWSKCYIDFQEEFGPMIICGVKKSKTLKDIRNYFIKNLNLPVLYDFAISKNLI